MAPSVGGPAAKANILTSTGSTINALHGDFGISFQSPTDTFAQWMG